MTAESALSGDACARHLRAEPCSSYNSLLHGTKLKKTLASNKTLLVLFEAMPGFYFEDLFYLRTRAVLFGDVRLFYLRTRRVRVRALGLLGLGFSGLG